MTDKIGVVFVHYHLQRGGVTRVMQNACAALGERADVLAVTGPEDNNPIEGSSGHLVVPELAYGEPVQPKPVGDVADELLAAVRAHWRERGVQRYLWHIHNHSLGKNATLPELVFDLAQRGERQLLQIHDFAEDCRPENFKFLLSRVGQGDAAELGARLYPQAPHVQYAVLNRRDYRFLQQTGISTGVLHLLANPVSMPDAEDDGRRYGHGGSRFFVYPTRAIRRKNIGELLLWSALGESGDRFATTLAPENPVHFPIYNEWIQFAEEMQLPVEFELASHTDLPFLNVLRSADALITTSVAEGFGLAFLEPWLAGKPLAGRDLPDITSDFAEHGIDLSHLYSKIRVPVAWLGEDLLRETFVNQARHFIGSYDRPFHASNAEAAFDAIVADGYIDFGRLNEGLQKEAIRMVSESPACRSELSPSTLAFDVSEDTIERNRERIESQYNLVSYGDKLLDIYRGLMESEPASVEAIPAGPLLNCFLDPACFSMIRM